MFLPNTIGLLAGFLTTVAFLPQLFKMLRSRSAKDLSLEMYLIYTLGVLCWLIYGIMADQLPVILWNAIGLVLASTVLTLKITYDRRESKV